MTKVMCWLIRTLYWASYHEPSPVLVKKIGKNEARGFVRGSGILGDRFSPPQPPSVSSKLYAKFVFCFWLCRVLVALCGIGMWGFFFSVAAYGIFSCGMWDLVPWPGIKPRPPVIWAQSLSHWTTREVPKLSKMWMHWLYSDRRGRRGGTLMGHLLCTRRFHFILPLGLRAPGRRGPADLLTATFSVPSMMPDT